ncbi:hypothetical protein ABEP12_10145 [Bacillus velezensis]|uniref:hypothetical protein n=1 Tax=Bacillus amyloliquefaciens TaxID=1390 RepID=UPI003750FADE
MEMYDGFKLRETRKKKGDQPCDHAWEVEYHNGSKTGDYVCWICGTSEFKATIDNKNK